MEDCKNRDIRTPKPVNRLSQNLAWVIKSHVLQPYSSLWYRFIAPIAHIPNFLVSASSPWNLQKPSLYSPRCRSTGSHFRMFVVRSCRLVQCQLAPVTPPITSTTGGWERSITWSLYVGIFIGNLRQMCNLWPHVVKTHRYMCDGF